jgi:hypothetical protein
MAGAGTPLRLVDWLTTTVLSGPVLPGCGALLAQLASMNAATAVARERALTRSGDIECGVVGFNIDSFLSTGRCHENADSRGVLRSIAKKNERNELRTEQPNFLSSLFQRA